MPFGAFISLDNILRNNEKKIFQNTEDIKFRTLNNLRMLYNAQEKSDKELETAKILYEYVKNDANFKKYANSCYIRALINSQKYSEAVKFGENLTKKEKDNCRYLIDKAKIIIRNNIQPEYDREWIGSWGWWLKKTSK